ncbi:hypothetical protein D3C71_1997340 [compost metagenome]
MIVPNVKSTETLLLQPSAFREIARDQSRAGLARGGKAGEIISAGKGVRKE